MSLVRHELTITTKVKYNAIKAVREIKSTLIELYKGNWFKYI